MSDDAPRGSTTTDSPYPSYPSYPSHPGYPAYPTRDAYRGPVSQTPATWAIILAVVPIPVGWLVSVGLAISVLRDSRDGRGKERGAGMATASLVVVSVWVLVVVAMASTGVFGQGAERAADGHLTSGGDVSTSSLRTGDCLPEVPRTTGISLTVEVVPCSAEHVGEVFAVFALGEGAFPGDAQVARLGEGGCVRRYEEARSGTAAVEPDLFYFLPTRASWSTDCRVVCLTVTPEPEADVA